MKKKIVLLYDDKEGLGINSGLGLHLIRDMAKAIHCRITVYTKIGLGTTILLAFEQIFF
jgi:nitrate/nitrite-specific signal transduction histidine kinase